MTTIAPRACPPKDQLPAAIKATQTELARLKDQLQKHTELDTVLGGTYEVLKPHYDRTEALKIAISGKQAQLGFLQNCQKKALVALE